MLRKINAMIQDVLVMLGMLLVAIFTIMVLWGCTMI